MCSLAFKLFNNPSTVSAIFHNFLTPTTTVHSYNTRNSAISSRYHGRWIFTRNAKTFLLAVQIEKTESRRDSETSTTRESSADEDPCRLEDFLFLASRGMVSKKCLGNEEA